ncbi:MAG: amino acid adenylation domain-containing protein [Cyclobacteriaceae bacterium]
MSNYNGLEIAIIGMSGQFPGATDVNTFWENLKNGTESIQLLNYDDILVEGEAKSILDDPNYVKASSTIEGKEYFDSAFFDIRPEEAALMDPQMRIFLQTCYAALEDAGCNIAENEEKVGLFAGGASNHNWETYSLLKNQDNHIDGYTASQLRQITYMCSRVSYLLNLKGPAVYLNTACSTSLVAIQRACMSLLLNECKMALAGGVRINNFINKGYVYQEGMINSKDGHCKPFDESSSGTIGGEGCGVVVLKKLKDALKDGDPIHAIIKGSGVNNDGSDKMAFTAPSVDGQSKAILKAMNMAKIDPDTISYVEAHGTGTTLGDPIEIEALNLAYGKSDKKYCALGSVKGNIGHLDVAAGVTGLIKTVLSLKNKQIPPSLHFESPNPRINFKNSPFYINNKLTDWVKDSTPRRAGVSSFGIGGTNAHVVLEEGPAQTSTSNRKVHLLRVSGKSKTALTNNIKALRSFLTKNPEIELANVAYTLHTGRQSLPYRATFACNDVEDAVRMLDQTEVNTVTKLKSTNSSLAFMFSGQGSQYLNMCRDLYHKDPTFRRHVDECVLIAKSFSDKDFLKAVYNPNERLNLVDQTSYTQPILFIFEYALASMLNEAGINPDILIGHSIGEYVAACMSEVFTLKDALRLVIRRGELMQSAPTGDMLSVAIEPEKLEALLNKSEGIDIAVINSDFSCVVSGTTEAVRSFKEEIETLGYSGKDVKTSHAFHSYLMDDILNDFEKEVNQTILSKPVIPFVSNVTGKLITTEDAINPTYWVKQLRDTVQFAKGAETLLQDKNIVLLEVGPGKTLTSAIKRNACRTKDHKVINTVRHPLEETDDLKYLVSSIGKLWEAGLDIDRKKYYAEENLHKVSLPTYSFDKIKFPVIVDAGRMITQMISESKENERNSLDRWFYIPTWKVGKVSRKPNKASSPRTLVLSNDSEDIRSLVQALKDNGGEVLVVNEGDLFQKTSTDTFQVRVDHNGDFDDLVLHLINDGTIPERIIHAWGVDENNPEYVTEPFISRYFYSLFAITKSLSLKNKLSGISLTVISKGLHSLPHESESLVSPAKALPIGLLRTIRQENPSITVGHIDIDRSGVDIKVLVDELDQYEQGKVVALRGSARFVQTFDQTSLPSPSELQNLKYSGTYIITGGLGELGYNIAYHLTHQYQANLILTGRSELTNSEEKQSRLATLNEKAGSASYYTCQMDDEAKLAYILNEARTKFGKIDGIVHAAGIASGTGFDILTDLDRSEFENHFASKVYGLELLSKLTREDQPDFCILISSLSSVLGGITYGAYATANLYMDYFLQAAHNRGELLEWTSLNFDGLNFKDTASFAIDRTEQLQVIERVIAASDHSQIIVSVSDLETRYNKWVKGEGQQTEEYTQDVISETTTASENAEATIESSLISMWNSFFGKGDIQSYDDFFDIGGDSLQALTMIGRIHQAFGLEISIKTFFENSKLSRLAAYLENLMLQLKDDSSFGNIPLADAKPYYSLSSAQKRLFFLNQFDDISTAYNSSQIVRIEGEINKEKLESTFRKLIERHEGLRTSFKILDGVPVQVINEKVPFEVKALHTDQANLKSKVYELIKPFDLGSAPLFRAGLIVSDADDQILVVDMHHIITDGVSHTVLMNDFMALYKDEDLPELRLQYRDYAEWQQSEQYRKDISDQKAYWLKTFEEEPPLLQMPTDYPRPTAKNSAGEAYFSHIDIDTTARLHSLAQTEKATLYMVLFSVFNVLLSKLSSQEDITVGTDFAGRPHADLEKVIGMFVNTAVIRSFPKGSKTFKTYLSDVKASILEAIENQDYQYEQLVEDLEIERSTSHNPLFDVVFALQNFKENTFELPGLTLSQFNFEYAVSKFDLTFIAEESNGQIIYKMEYSTQLFKRSTIEKFARYFEALISQITEDISVKISDLSVLSSEDRKYLLFDLNDTDVKLPENETTVSIFERRVIDNPDKIAVRFGKEALTYDDLNKKVNRLAAFLLEKIEGKSAVPVYIEPSIDLLTTMLALFKSGLTYVPISTESPVNRVIGLLDDLDAKILITKECYISEKASFFNSLAASTRVNTLLYIDIDQPNGKDVSLFYTYRISASLMAGESVEIPTGLPLSNGKFNLPKAGLEVAIHKVSQTIRQETSTVKGGIGVLVRDPLYKVIVLKALQRENTSYQILDGIENAIPDDLTSIITEHGLLKKVDELFWRKGNLKSLILVDQYNEQSEKEEVFKDIWNHMADATSDALNDYGWSNSYTAESFSIKEMDEYVDNFSDKLSPYLNEDTRVLEIGCGHGVVLFKIAPKVAYYHATDLAPNILNKNRERLDQQGITHVVQEAYGAADIDKVREKNFDVIVCSSVVHYFPDTIYLEKVICDSINLLADKGVIYLDDLIDLSKKDNLLKSTDDHKKNNPSHKTKTNWDNDLFINKEFFEYLQEKYPQVECFEATSKNGKIDNELTRYRFDVVLKINKKAVRKTINPKAKRRHVIGAIANSFELPDNLITPNNAVLNSGLLGYAHIANYSDTNPRLTASLDDLAYIIYTSGTTGKPKGAMVHHKGMLNHLYAKINDLGITGDDIVAETAPASFDISIWQFISTLLVGGHCHIISKDILVEPALLIKELDRGEVTIFESVPSLITAFLDGLPEGQAHILDNLRWMIPTGEALSVSLTRKWYRYFPEIKLLNAYGPTEASDDVTHHVVEVPIERQTTISIGKPIQNTHIYILDRYLNLCPVGVHGEICVVGLGVGYGYWKNEEKTHNAFVKNPFVEETGKNEYQTLYKTGDIGYIDGNGNIICLGRLDEQVKIRGNRIELGEIDSVLSKLPEIEDVVVDAKEVGGEKQLVAFYLAGEILDIDYLQRHIVRSLPDYMVPSYFIKMDEFPITDNGKLNRKALPEPTYTSDKKYVAPETEKEILLQNIWAEVLGIEASVISVDSNFFELGGHSLKAMVLVNKVSKQLEVELPLKSVFELATIQNMADHLDRADKTDHMSIQPVADKEYYVLSAAQRRQYFLYVFEKTSTAYNIPKFVRLKGELSIDRLESALNGLIDRHESLRTSFLSINDEPVQRIDKSVPFSIEHWDCAESGLHSVIEEFIRPFELTKAPLFRVGLARVSSEDHLLMFDIHHIIADGTSMDILTKDFMVLYSDGNLPNLNLQYKDYAEWQHQDSQQQHLKEQKDFWLSQFSEEAPVLELPTDKNRPDVKTQEGDRVSFKVDSEAKAVLEQLAKEEGCTIFMVLLSAYSIFLSKLSNQEDVVIGTPVSGRQHIDLENILGMFINTLPVRTKPHGELRFREFLSIIKETTLSSFENQGYQYEELIESLNLERDISRNPLFDVMFVYENFEKSEVDLPGIKLESFSNKNLTSKFDLLLACATDDDHLYFTFEYYSRIFSRNSIDRFASYFINLLKEVASDPDTKLSQLSLINRVERQNILRGYNNTLKEHIPQKTIAQHFEDRVVSQPDSIAVTFNGQSMTYHRLNEEINRMANMLRDKGVQRNTLVGVMINRSIEMVVSLMAIIKAGGAYLPLDPSHPDQRISHILKSSQLSLLLIDSASKDRDLNVDDIVNVSHVQTQKYSAFNPEYINDTSDLLYVIYTSGSTGLPKGAMVTHRNMINLLDFEQNETSIDFSSVIQFTTLSFDPSVLEIFSTLTYGGKVTMVDKATVQNFSALLQQIRNNEVRTLYMPSSVLNQIFNNVEYSNQLPDCLKHIFTAGEQVVIGPLFKSFLRQNGTTIHNHYGPAETHVATTYTIEPDSEIPTMPHIGKPVSNTTIYILDKYGNIQPSKVPGEIFIGGIQVGLGYLNNSDLTSYRFIDDPFCTGGKMYKTGDLARWTEEGNIEFLGRIDDQVKINGIRIEPGEVESALTDHPDIRETAVIVHEQEGRKLLVGYYVSEKQIQAKEIRSFMIERVPIYMVPAQFVHLTEMPLTATGKLAYKALPIPDMLDGRNFVEPTNKVEQKLQSIWANVLKVDQEKVSIDHNFFQLGGHSLSAITLSNKILKEFAIEISVRELFVKPTIRQLAEELDAELWLKEKLQKDQLGNNSNKFQVRI